MRRLKEIYTNFNTLTHWSKNANNDCKQFVNEAFTNKIKISKSRASNI